MGRQPNRQAAPPGLLRPDLGASKPAPSVLTLTVESGRRGAGAAPNSQPIPGDGGAGGRWEHFTTSQMAAWTKS